MSRPVGAVSKVHDCAQSSRAHVLGRNRSRTLHLFNTYILTQGIDGIKKCRKINIVFKNWDKVFEDTVPIFQEKGSILCREIF